MMTMVIVGGSRAPIDLSKIESMIPCWDYHQHLYEDAQEDLPFPFSRFLRRIACLPGEEHSPLSGIPGRLRIITPPQP